MGPSPHGRLDILDVDSVQMIWMLRRMRDENHFLDGREIKFAPQLFLGAAGSPFASETRFQAVREKKKSNAGAQFFQTNLIYNPSRFQEYLEALDKQGVLKQSYLLAGVAPIRSYKAAKMMQNIPGIEIPDALVTRMENATDGKEEGIQICLEIVDQVKNLPGVNGIHFMAMGWESIIPRLVRESGLAPQ
jgi:methylenetetrahydrofolate reductase (NADPH)